MNNMHRDEVLDFIEAESGDMQHIRGLKRYGELLVLDSLVCATIIGVVQPTVFVSVHRHLVRHQRVQGNDLVLSVADDLCIGVAPEEQVRHERLPEHKRNSSPGSARRGASGRVDGRVPLPCRHYPCIYRGAAAVPPLPRTVCGHRNTRRSSAWRSVPSPLCRMSCRP